MRSIFLIVLFFCVLACEDSPKERAIKELKYQNELNALKAEQERKEDSLAALIYTQDSLAVVKDLSDSNKSRR